MISNSASSSAFCRISSTRPMTRSSSRYSRQLSHCNTGKPFKMTILVSLTLKGKSVIKCLNLEPQTPAFHVTALTPRYQVQLRNKTDGAQCAPYFLTATLAASVKMSGGKPPVFRVLLMAGHARPTLLTPEKGQAFPLHHPDIIHRGIGAVKDAAAGLDFINHHSVGFPGHEKSRVTPFV